MTNENKFIRWFERLAMTPSDEAARRHLATGRSVSYRERDTPPGHVLREHPDGSIDLVRIDMADGGGSTVVRTIRCGS